MIPSLESRLRKYLGLVGSLLAQEKRASGRPDENHPRWHPSEDERLRLLVDTLERQQEFVALVRATEDEYSEDLGGLSVTLAAEPLVKNFFRQSGLYLDAWAGQPILVDSVVQRFRQAFERGKATTTYLAPLEGVEFAEDKMDFGDFRIERFDDPHQLDALLGGRIRRAFYPWAVIDAEELRWHWLLLVSDPGPKAGAHDNDLRRVPVSYSPFPEALERCLRSLFLFPWHSVSAHTAGINLASEKMERDPWAGPQHFDIPFYFEVSDSVIKGPPPAPDLSALQWEEPDEDGRGGPVLWLSLDPRETQEFCICIRETFNMLNEVVDNGPPEWRFMSVGLKFFVKGCLTTGLESLLWYITAIEALVGEDKRRQITELLARRVGKILSATKQDGDNVEKKFKELWRLRCDLVHGKTTLESHKIFYGHLGEAHEMSTQVTLWMLRQLHEHIRAAPRKLPTREHFLTALDG